MVFLHCIRSVLNTYIKFIPWYSFPSHPWRCRHSIDQTYHHTQPQARTLSRARAPLPLPHSITVLASQAKTPNMRAPARYPGLESWFSEGCALICMSCISSQNAWVWGVAPLLEPRTRGILGAAVIWTCVQFGPYAPIGWVGGLGTQLCICGRLGLPRSSRVLFFCGLRVLFGGSHFASPPPNPKPVPLLLIRKSDTRAPVAFPPYFFPHHPTGPSGPSGRSEDGPTGSRRFQDQLPTSTDGVASTSSANRTPFAPFN